jgi:hypothetical protein
MLTPEGRLRGYGVSSQSQFEARLPHWKFFKAFVPHRAPLESEILNLKS